MKQTMTVVSHLLRAEKAKAFVGVQVPFVHYATKHIDRVTATLITVLMVITYGINSET